jgi:hypothetical protein
MEFNTIRNKIRTFTYDSLASLLLQLLKNQEASERVSPIWHPLVLLKWTLEFAGQKDSKHATPQDINKLMNMIDELEMTHQTFNMMSNTSFTKTFSILSFQQFSYQESVEWDTFSRQYLLFVGIPGRHSIASVFEKQTGVTVVELLKYFFVLWAFVMNDAFPKEKYRGYLPRGLQALMGQHFGRLTAERIYNLLLISKSNAHTAFLEDKRQVKIYALQTFDTSFFTRKPFFLYRDSTYIPHRDILNQSFSYFIYDYLKANDDDFTTELGARMEKYMKLGLEESNTPFETENELKKRFGREHKVVDFVIDDCVLIEAKAIELKPSVGVDPRDHILGNELRQNISKAYASQMLGVANRLQPGKERFGIIVTYKPIYIGNSADMWEQFLEKETNTVLADDISKLDALPVSNLFLTDLRTWDTLLQVLKDNPIKLADLLREVRDADAIPATKKHFFAMHLSKFKVQLLTHNYLVEARKHVTP